MPRQRPQCFGEFIGQPRVVDYLSGLIAGSLELQLPCPPLWIKSGPGMGKTTLARACAAQYGSDLHALIGDPDVSPKQAVEVLGHVDFGDFLFIDEAHALPRAVQELLCQALDDEKVPVPGKAGDAGSVFQSVAAFSLVVATTKPSGLIPAFRSRLLPVELVPYTPLELAAIARRVAEQSGRELTAQAANALAELPLLTPRCIEHYLDELARFFPGHTHLGVRELQELFRHKGISAQGLGPWHRRYLRILEASPRHTASVHRLAKAIGVDDRASIGEDVEPLLLHLALVDITAGNQRRLTPAGAAAVADFPGEPDADQKKSA
jgi:Holliday junction resolvasome RuvABC ATP-dependent DNA helicase subunit